MNRHIKPVRTNVSLVVFACLLTTSALAETKPKQHTDVLGMKYLIDAETSYGREKNITLQSDSADAIDSDYYAVVPEFHIQSQFNDDYYSLGYKGEYKDYISSNADSYQDHWLSSDNFWQLGSRHLLNLSLKQSWDHEIRGDESTAGLSDKQLRYYGVNEALLTESTFGELSYHYGAINSRGKLEVSASYKDKTFRDLDSVANATRVPDFVEYLKGEERQITAIQLGFIDKYSSDTTFRFGILRNNIAYKADVAKDTHEYYLRFGMSTTLGSTFTTEGNISWLHKEFLNLEKTNDFDGLNWDVSLKWQPFEYSTWKATTSQNVEDASVGGEYTLNSSAGISWQHFWIDKSFSTITGYEYIRKKHKNDGSGRRDHSNELSLAVSYDFNPSINITFQYMTLTEDSNKEFDSFYINENQNPMTKLGYDKSKLALTAKVKI